MDPILTADGGEPGLAVLLIPSSRAASSLRWKIAHKTGDFADSHGARPAYRGGLQIPHPGTV
jgi:hypothetical protein